jgi:NAD-dependent dihydropyrimidine dehydrogenase PreA subunit
MRREIVLIDEERCDGCGLCIPACQEGALQLVDGKAKLISDDLCDGLGACLGHCPHDAIRIEYRDAEAFDEEAVTAHLGQGEALGHDAPATRSAEEATQAPPCACPSSRFAELERNASPERRIGEEDPATNGERSELAHWPVQLRLLPPSAPVLRNASLLLAADCVPVALPGFHQRLLRGRAVAIACPKLDDPRGYREKLTEMIRLNDIKDITVAHMQVPCCSGLLAMVVEARRASGKTPPIVELVISTRGERVARKDIHDAVGVEFAC